MTWRSRVAGAALALALAVGTLVALPAQQAEAATVFDPGDIISDGEFYDANAMTSAQIQSFLDAKIGTCSNANCLNVAVVPVPDWPRDVSSRTGNVVCEAITGGTMRVSELIYRTQVACGISAKVILVTLQKEQGLVTSKAPSETALRWAMGMACPDTAPCNTAFAGLATQIVTGTRQLKTYKAGAFARQPGVHFIGYHPNAACGGTNVNIRNYATAALYNYTPYQPNAASLANLYRTGDSCSSYGNRNFWAYYRDWFGFIDGPPPGSPSAPQALHTTQNHGGKLTLAWSPPANYGDTIVTDYRISYTSPLHPNPVVINDGVSLDTTFSLNNPTPGLAFTFHVEAVNTAGAGERASLSVTPPPPGAPSAPQNLRVTVNDGSQVAIAWDAPVYAGDSAVTDYVISYTSAFHTSPVIVNDGVSTSTTQTFMNPTPGLAFVFRVQAKNAVGTSEDAWIAATPRAPGDDPEDLTLPGPVTGLRVSVNDGSTLTLVWAPPSSPGASAVTDYVIAYTSPLHPTPVVVNDGVTTTTTHTFVNPTPGLAFTLHVQAKNTEGVGAVSTIQATPPAYPGTPQNLRVTVNDGEALTLVWDAPAGGGAYAPTDYVISYTSVHNPSPIVINDGDSTATTHTIVRPTPGIAFTFRVQAKNASGLSPAASVQVTAPSPGTPSASAPSVPQNLRVSVNSGGVLTLVWDAPASDGGSAVTDYVISYTSPFHPSPVPVNDGVSTSTTHTFVNPTPGLAFTFRVQAKNAAGTGPVASVSATPPPPGSGPSASAPSVPQNLRVSVNSGGVLTLVWDAPASDGGSAVTDYVISYTSPFHPSPVPVNDGVSTSTTHTFVNPTPGLAFTFRVQAKNAAGTGPLATVQATPPG
jgi:hypothetical protein